MLIGAYGGGDLVTKMRLGASRVAPYLVASLETWMFLGKASKKTSDFLEGLKKSY